MSSELCFLLLRTLCEQVSNCWKIWSRLLLPGANFFKVSICKMKKKNTLMNLIYLWKKALLGRHTAPVRYCGECLGGILEYCVPEPTLYSASLVTPRKISFFSDLTTDQIPCQIVPTVPVATVLTKLFSVAVASLLLEQNRIEDDESYCRAWQQWHSGLLRN